MAVQHAYTILGWQEHLMEHEMPPRWMWAVDHELKDWFEQVQRDRDEKYGTSRDKKDTRETVPMMENELARRR